MNLGKELFFINHKNEYQYGKRQALRYNKRNQ